MNVKSASRPRIALLGPNGQAGWELLRTLQTLGEVVSIGRPEINLTNADSIRRAIRLAAPQLVVNAAAYTAVDKAESEPELAMAANGTAPGVLAEECLRLNAALVHYSTDYVFAGDGTHCWRETDPVAPPNVYGKTKLAGEQAIAAVGAPHLILRVSWVYGLHGANFVKTMLRLASQRSELRVVNDQWGAPTSARAIADVTGQILAQGRRDWPAFFGARGGVVHAVCQGTTNWHSFAERIVNLARRRGYPVAATKVTAISTNEFPTPAVRPLNSRMDCSLLGKRFGLALPPWDAALEQSFPAPPELAAVAQRAA